MVSTLAQRLKTTGVSKIYRPLQLGWYSTLSCIWYTDMEYWRAERIVWINKNYLTLREGAVEGNEQW